MAWRWLPRWLPSRRHRVRLLCAIGHLWGNSVALPVPQLLWLLCPLRAGGNRRRCRGLVLHCRSVRRQRAVSSPRRATVAVPPKPSRRATPCAMHGPRPCRPRSLRQYRCILPSGRKRRQGFRVVWGGALSCGQLSLLFLRAQAPASCQGSTFRRCHRCTASFLRW